MSSKPAILAENLGKRFRIGGHSGRPSTLGEALTSRLKHPFRRTPQDAFWALRDISFEIAEGDVVGVVGRNGAGKSTLLKLLSRITGPTTGRIDLYGRVGSLLEVGTGFHPELTGRENIFLNGALLGMTRREISRKFDEIVAFSEVETFLDTPVKRYSSGMYVRLAFAVAAHLDPEILIVDEVLAVGDAAFQQKCLGKMQEIADSQGRTVIFVSHSVAAIRKLCRRALFLEKGRCTVCSTVEEAIALYEGGEQSGSDVVDISGTARSDFGGPHRFGTRARVLSAGRTGPLRYGEPMTVQFRLQVERPLAAAHMNVTFETMEGVPALTLDSLNDGQTFELQPGTYDLEFALDWTPLHPARYYGNVAISSGGELLDHVFHAFVWVVDPPAADALSSFGNGGCRWPVRATLRELAPV